MRHHQQQPFWNKNCYLIAQFQIHTKVQYLCPVTWNISPGKSNGKSRVYENTFKIFPTIHQIPIPYWWHHCSRLICLHKNHQRNVYTKIGSHKIIQSYYFSHGSTRLLSSALHNWTLGTQDQRTKFCLCADYFAVKYFTKDDANHLLDFLKKYYAISTDWEGYNYLKLTIYWSYSKEYFNILIP